MEIITSVFQNATTAAASVTDTQDPFLHVLSAGSCLANAPWSYEAAPLPCYLLLYTKKGCGKLLSGSQVYTLSENTLVFCSCESRVRLDIALTLGFFHLPYSGSFPGNLCGDALRRPSFCDRCTTIFRYDPLPAKAPARLFLRSGLSPSSCTSDRYPGLFCHQAI